VPALRADPARLETALRQKKDTQLQAVAQLLITAAQAERDTEIEVLSIPAPDMFFMLDDGVVAELYGDYPGHEQAEAEWRQTQRPGHQIGRKRFRAERYQVPDDLGMYANVATQMRERDIVPEALTSILDRLAEWSE